MPTAALTLGPHEALLPPRGRTSGGPAALLSLLAHGTLVGALAWGVNWRIDQPQVLSAELWASVPQQAAPPPAPSAAPAPTPAPTPLPTPAPAPATAKAVEPDAQIAVERADRQRREREAQEQAARDKAQAARERREQEQREAKAQEDRLARQREENLRRMMGAAGAGSAPAAQATSGTSARDAAPSAAYAGRLRARIRPNIVFAEDARGNPEAEVEVRCAPEGTIVSRRIIKSSGIKAWDEAVLRAIDKTERLPPDVDGRVPATLLIAFRPRE